MESGSHQANCGRARIGVWVPPRMNPGLVTAAVQDAWPGAKVTATTTPALDGRVVVVEVRARNGVWAPWTETRPRWLVFFVR
ncbi:hypothetical protein ABIA39_002674 [Nocardia sp. GAS34]|uniref:hypothetical protein n=1 Tax=unclassified Nocardia TaxID=2637762 RepID=UPI003D20DB03